MCNRSKEELKGQCNIAITSDQEKRDYSKNTMVMTMKNITKTKKTMTATVATPLPTN